MRYGVYGGSFDPIHRGHVAAVVAVADRRALERVFLVPAAAAPHKEGGSAASFEHRLAMATIAVQDHPGLAVSDIEGRRERPSYTIDTIEELAAGIPGTAELLVGADMVADLPNWHRADELVAAVTVVGFGRPGADASASRAAFEGRFGPGKLVWVEIPPVRASSTEIRRRLAAGEPADDLLNPAVTVYVRLHGVYTEGG